MSLLFLAAAMMLSASILNPAAAAPKDKTFGEDVEFLRKHKATIVLASKDGQSKIAVVPGFQGRIMTSTAAGNRGTSFGSINYDLIASGKLVPKINAFGGEDRFWMGPEGGQFAIFFEKGDKFTLDDWQTPACIDSVEYEVVSEKPSQVEFRHDAEFANYSGTNFKVRISRLVRLIDRAAAAADLGVSIGDDLAVVAFESDNSITNTGDKAWQKDTGLLSLWVLGMFKPSDSTVVIAPFNNSKSEAALGPFVNDNYFGKVPANRVQVDRRNGVIYFRGDAKMRTKIGLSPSRSTPVVGSWDPTRNVLTIVKYTLPESAANLPYINSMWEIQKDPYAGDVINSYNHGDIDKDGNPVNGFYELETSSPAAALKPGESASHRHRTIHIVGPREALDPIAKQVLGVDLKTAESALK
jgi:hypothetical protein